MEDVWKGMETMEREGLDTVVWTEGHSDCRAGRVENGGGEVKGNDGENWYGGGGGWNRAERAGEIVCYKVFGPGMWTISLVNSEM